MTNRRLRALLLVLPILCVASRRGEAQELPAFDHQLELFTRLAIEGKVAEAEAFLREPAFLRAADVFTVVIQHRVVLRMTLLPGLIKRSI